MSEKTTEVVGLGMDKIDNELIEKLYLENTAYDFVMEFLNAFHFPNRPTDNLEEQRRSVTRNLYKENLGCHIEYCVMESWQKRTL